MFVQPINFTSIVSKNAQVKAPSFKSYENHDGSPIPEIEQVKYHKTMEAEHHIQNGDYASAAKVKFEIADICRRQGKERDAYLLECGAKKLLSKVKPRI